MKKAILFSLLVVVSLIVGSIFIYNKTPSPEYFNVVQSPLVIEVGEKIDFVKDYYPDESHLIFQCVCEACDQELATLELIVE